MNLTAAKPIEEILGSLEGDAKVLILACGGCPLGCETATPAQVDELSKKLQESGKEVTGVVTVDFACNKALVGIKLGRNADAVMAADSILVMSCGVGVQAVGNMVGKRVVPGMNTISQGGQRGLAAQGIWPSSERCGECGDCLLAVTGGICPITTCSKSLVNGACGGTNDGKCEVSPDRDCGWFLIYQRLKELGRLDDLRKLNKPRDFSKRDFPDAMRRTIRYALEVDEEAAEAETAAKEEKA